jgi:hypothetical protein
MRKTSLSSSYGFHEIRDASLGKKSKRYEALNENATKLGKVTKLFQIRRRGILYYSIFSISYILLGYGINIA